MSLTYRTKTIETETGVRMLILPTRLHKRPILGAWLECTRFIDPSEVLSAYREHLAIAAQKDAYELRHTTAPAITQQQLKALDPRSEQIFWQVQGELRHRTAPNNLTELTRRLTLIALQPGLPMQPGEADGQSSWVPHRIYQPHGPWEWLAPQSPHDLKQRARLTLPRGNLRAPLLPDLLPALVGAYPLTDHAQYRVRVYYEPTPNVNPEFFEFRNTNGNTE